ncbi:MAG: carboxypeptidase-like regulatory domain-containing protein [Bacteroidia bacterium]|nr:carboxypeptidase-like regulatory domain-containing protein [Bacteroidia bacterium]
MELVRLRRSDNMIFSRVVLLLLGSLIPLLVHGQILVTGIVTDKNTGKAIPGVNIRIMQSGKKSVTGSTGCFRINTEGDKPVRLRFTHISYDTAWATIPPNGDSAFILVSLQPSQIMFEPVLISGSHKPDTVIGSSRFFINDFEFFGEQIVLLTFEKKPEKSKVMLADKDSRIISTFPIPVNGEELFRDFLGNVNVIGKDSVYRVLVKENNLRLVSVPPEEFEHLIRPCIDTVAGKIVFSDYRDDYPEFSYYSWDPSDSVAVRLRHILDEDLALMYSFEYDFLTTRQKVYARKMELATGIDKREIAAYMTNFSGSRYFTPLYAPLFVISDTLYLFEHYKNYLYRMDKDGKVLDSSSINYHKPEKWREWRRRLIREENGSRVFGLFLKDGYYSLKEIDIRSGKVISVSRLYFPYVGKIRVKDGYAWYIYRPFESQQSKFLYKERLNEYK